MNEQNKKQIKIMAGLGAVLVAVLVYQFFIAGGTGGSGASTAAGTPAVAGAKPAAAGAGAPVAAAKPGQPVGIQQTDVDVKVLLASLKQEPIKYSEVRIQRNPMTPLIGQLEPQDREGGITDPTKPQILEPTVTLSPLEELKNSVRARRITAIVWDAKDPIAVVDNEVVSVGHTFPDGVQVDSIDPSRVVFRVDTEQIPVEMKEK